MKHLKLFESFGNSLGDYLMPDDISKQGDTVIMFNEGDGWRCTLLNGIDAIKFERKISKIDDIFFSTTNKPGIAYCLGQADGEMKFKGLDFKSETSKYEFRISAEMGDVIEAPEGMSSDFISEDTIFTLKRGYITTFNAHGQVESIPVKEYMEYLKGYDM
jgi:hypothetical protein